MPELSPSTRERIVRHAPSVALSLGILLQAWLSIQWIGFEGRVGEPVVCEAIWPVNALISAAHSGTLGPEALLEPGLSSWLGLAGHALLGGGGSSLLLTMLLCMVACQLLAFDLGRLLGDRWIGVLAALLLPLFPDIALLGRRWGPILPQLMLLLAMADLLIRSRSLSLPILALGVGLLGAAGALFSPFSTHDLLFLAAAGSLCAGAALRGLITGRAALPGEPVGRLRVLLGCVLAAAPMLVASWYVVHFHTVTSYYTAEANAEVYAGAGQVWHPWFLTAYLRLLATASAGPLLASAAGLGLLGFLWRGRGRVELLLWGLGPIVVLSLIAKKNWYYAAVVFPVLPLLVALGLRALPWRWPRVGLGALLLLAAGFGWWQASFGDGVAPGWYRLTQADPAFQSPPGQTLLPVPTFRWARQEALLRQALPGPSCPDGASVGMLPDAQAPDLVLALKDLDPCLDTHLWTVSRDFDWMIHSDPHCVPQAGTTSGPVGQEVPRPAAVRSCERQGRCAVVVADLGEAPCLWVVRSVEAGGDEALPGSPDASP
jgi:hypothetical protein